MGRRLKWTFVDTIFVTKSAAKKGWKFSPKDGRPDFLPAWYGDLEGKSKKIFTTEIGKFTTALQIIDKVVVEF